MWRDLVAEVCSVWERNIVGCECEMFVHVRAIETNKRAGRKIGACLMVFLGCGNNCHRYW